MNKFHEEMKRQINGSAKRYGVLKTGVGDLEYDFSCLGRRFKEIAKRMAGLERDVRNFRDRCL